MSFRVLILAAEYPHQNKEKDGIFIQDQAMALNQNNIRADIVFVEPRSIRTLSLSAIKENYFQLVESVEEGVFTYRIKGWNPFMNSTMGGLLYTKITEWAVQKYIKKHGKPDIVHAHNTFWAGLSALHIAERLNIPYVLTEHSSRFLLNSITDKMAFYGRAVISGAEIAIGVSDKMSSELQRFGSRNMTTIPNVVDTDYFSLSESKHNNVFTFVGIGNMTSNKGFDVLINAFQSFKGSSKCRLILAGDGPKIGDYKSLVAKLGLDDKVTFVGKVGREEVRDILWKADALVMSSYKETFGVVLIEALSTGIPVIASSCGGPDDIVCDEIGYLFEPGNSEQLSNLMIKIQNEAWDKNKLRQYAVSKFSREALVSRLRKLYKQVLEE